MFDPKIAPGSVLENQDLCSVFKCSPQGGMRKSNTTNSLLIISNHLKSIYDDRWLGDTFHYTGMGMSGDQSIDFMQNKTLAESQSNGVSVQLFEVFEDKKYTYIGPVELSGKPYRELQPDVAGEQRNVWMFPLQLKVGTPLVLPEERVEKLIKLKENKAKKLSDKELFDRAKQGSKIKTPGNRSILSTRYDRSVWISEYAKRKANGTCQLCGQEAPFKNIEGRPYLESHHRKWLSQGGDDSIQNIVALCPNCHRKMHVLNSVEDRRKLYKIADSY